MSLVIVMKKGEELTVGDARLRFEVRNDGCVRVFIDAPREIQVTRDSAKRKMVHG